MFSRTKIAGIAIVAVLFFSISCVTKINEKEDRTSFWEGVSSYLIAADCSAKLAKPQAGRVYTTGFESVSEFSQFYIVPQNYQNAASHELSSSVARSGNAHHSWIYANGPSCPPWINCNHRGYPTIQLHKTAQGGFRTPIYLELYAYIDATISAGEWFSFATLTPDASDAWARTVLVNLGNLNLGGGNFMHLMHVPVQGRSDWDFQTSPTNSPTPFPFQQWVRLEVCLDLDPTAGFAKVRQDGVKVSEAKVQGGCGILEQAHFGLYAPPNLSSGNFYNDDLTISEVASCPF
ncbi:hypothetical protein CH373_00010 [Leptospira perolatii]|uniref:Polysaccharide lyase n=1 Tax=Leptospira perolatii TaxID=2023191 RepID=A0A2M9ZR38_9LEPT|nr:polysaccharide lyase [Leptospira perolatii]PJZ70963.1 hypothetical protein CH360_00010 [Leptospira perolatii]PJZ74495.1 hypothetical protein CH373_00010 [Leptospira perolatii]